jgi:tetratricopeptide (TPR) repeat protein
MTYWLSRLVLAGLTAGLVVLGVVWWSDRPLVQAEAALAQGDVKFANYLVSKYLQRHPGHQRAMALQARVYVAAGYPEAALALFDQAGADTVADLQAWARALLMTEQWSLAIPPLEQVVLREPENADALYELTACRVRLGNLEQALEGAQRFARLPGQEARGHLFVGAILSDLGKHAEAVAAYEKVLQLDPEADNLQTPTHEFYLQYGQALLSLGKPEEALEPLKRSAAALETREVLLELGNAALQLGRVEHAQEAWRRAVVLDERYAVAREALARAALSQGHPDEALQWLAPLPEQDPTLETAYLRQRAYTLAGKSEEAQRWQAVAASLRKRQELRGEINNLVADSPQSFWGRAIRAHRFAEQGNWRQAELMVEALLQEAPGEPFIIELATAVHRRRDLPALESLPIPHH